MITTMMNYITVIEMTHVDDNEEDNNDNAMKSI